MSQDSYPHPYFDTEADGIPGPADDDSTAWDDVETGRSADGPAPTPVPGEIPQATERYGTTAAEQRHGEPLAYKLDQETRDPALNGVTEAASLDVGETPGVGEPSGVGEASSTDPHLDSPVSVYDRPGWSAEPGVVGRLVEPDGGLGPDEETQALGSDLGAAGGGPTAEELAMHEVSEESPDSAGPETYPGTEADPAARTSG